MIAVQPTINMEYIKEDSYFYDMEALEWKHKK